MQLHVRVFVGLLALLAVLASHILSGGYPSILVESLSHALHGPGFSALTLLYFLLVGATRQTATRYALAGTIAFACAIAAEVAQIPGPRDADAKDLLVDFIGIAGMLSLIAAIRGPLDIRWPRIVTVPVGIGLLAVVSWSSISITYSIVQQHLSKPTLIAFDSRWEKLLVADFDEEYASIIDAPKNWPTAEGRVYLASEQMPWGIFLKVNPFPDWRAFSALSFIASSERDEYFDLAINIWDLPEDGISGRLNAVIEIGPTPRRFRVLFGSFQEVPGYKALDLGRISSVVFSADTPGSDHSILLDDIRLEP